MGYQKIQVPASGDKITVNADMSLNVPNNPIIPFIEGDGIGVDISPVMIKVVDAAVATPEVWKGKENLLKIGRPDAIVVTVPAGSAGKIKTAVSRPDPLVAPFTKGQAVGSLKVMLGEQTLAEVPLVALEGVEQAGILGRAWDAIRLWIK